jgi:hypothetical protein
MPSGIAPSGTAPPGTDVPSAPYGTAMPAGGAVPTFRSVAVRRERLYRAPQGDRYGTNEEEFANH